MAPKAAAKNAAKKTVKGKNKTPLTQPVVTPQALQRAQQMLADEAELKRKRSSLAYFLETNGHKKAFNAMGSTAKKDFLDAWVAEQIEAGKFKTTKETVNRIEVENEGKATGEWMGKAAMIRLYGEVKAQAKIDSGVLKHRADPDTLKDCEWNREYYCSREQKITSERDKTIQNIKGIEDLETENQRKEAMAQFGDFKSCIAADTPEGGSGSSSSKDTIVVAPTSESEIKVKTESNPDLEASKHQKTLDALVKDRRKVFLACSEAVTVLKTYFKDTEIGRYTQELNQDLKKLIPKFSKVLKKLEAATISMVEDKPVLLAIASELDSCYLEYNTAEDWYYRLVPDAEAKVGKKRRRSA